MRLSILGKKKLTLSVYNLELQNIQKGKEENQEMETHYDENDLGYDEVPTTLDPGY